MVLNDEVLDFIEQFNGSGKDKTVIELFSCGMCFWFAYTLHGRFSLHKEANSEIVYDEVENHFGCAINGQVYDITGNVTGQYNWKPWIKVWSEDPVHAKRIQYECILKKDYPVE